MVELDSGEVVGSVGWSAQEWARPPSSRAWNAGMALVPEWRGRNVGRKAQQALCDYLFHDHWREPHRGGDQHSQHCGQPGLGDLRLHQGGVLREAAFHLGEVHDIAMYSLLRREWEQGRVVA